jgi:hypothetical protein
VTGGAKVTRYEVTAQKLRHNGTVASSDTVRVDAGTRALTMRLEPGRYRFTVVAVNAMGKSKAALSGVVRAQ